MELKSKHWCLPYIFTKVKCLMMKHWAISVSAWAGVEQISPACCLFILIMCQDNALSFHLTIFCSCAAIHPSALSSLHANQGVLTSDILCRKSKNWNVHVFYYCCFQRTLKTSMICFFLIILPPFCLLRIPFSSSTWRASRLRPRPARARLPRWPRPRPRSTLSANHPSPRRTWSRSAPSTRQPPPLLRRSARRAGTSSSTPPRQTSAAASRSFARCSSQRPSRRKRSFQWQTARLLDFHTRPAQPKRTRARRRPERCPQTPRPRTPRSLRSPSCSRRSSTCWSQAISRSRSCLFISPQEASLTSASAIVKLSLPLVPGFSGDFEHPSAQRADGRLGVQHASSLCRHWKPAAGPRGPAQRVLQEHGRVAARSGLLLLLSVKHMD